jgi:oxygen-dependent protoporphyrinogen oxidase
MTKRVAIVGGGLSGLSAAYDLSRAGIEFQLFESKSRLGGYLKTTARDGFLIENGADSWIAQKPWMDDLARDLGIADEIVASPAISPSTSILRDGKLVPLPPGLSLFVPSNLSATDNSSLISFETKRRFHEELTQPPTPLAEGKDESVADFVARHFGNEVVDVLAAPLLAGVYGGDASRLSARAVIPGLVKLESEHGSLIRGMQANRPATASKQGIFRTFRNGMESVIAALSSKLPHECVHLGIPVLRVIAKQAGFSVVTTRGTHDDFSDVVLALPVPAVAEMLDLEMPSISYSSAATVALAYDFVPDLPSGFGFLVASGEPCAIMAATFVHQKWPYRVPAGKSLIRAFIADPQLLAAPDGAMIVAARGALREVLGVSADPIFTVIDRWPNSMPQYEVGHLERIQQLREKVSQLGRVFLAGNSYQGVGMPDAVRSGRAAAQSALETA